MEYKVLKWKWIPGNNAEMLETLYTREIQIALLKKLYNPRAQQKQMSSHKYII